MKGTIKSTSEISAFFKNAKRIETRHLIALIRKTDYERGLSGRVAFIAGKKLGSAPQRNRAKRLMREAARQAGAPWLGTEVVWIAKRRIIGAKLDSVVVDMKRIRKTTTKGKNGD